MAHRSVVPEAAAQRSPRLQAVVTPLTWLRRWATFSSDTASSELAVPSSQEAQAAFYCSEAAAHRTFVEPSSAVVRAPARQLRWLAPFDALTAFGWLRFALAALLLTAAGLKAYQLATEPIFGTGFLHWRPLLIGVIEFELFLSLWLISGAYPRVLWWTTLICFVGFAEITLYHGVTGEASCGCFGTVQVNPWWMFLVDIAVVTLLLCFRQAARSEFRSRQRDRRRLTGAIALALIVGIPAGAAIVHFEPVLLRLGEDPSNGKSFILVEPNRWVGARFPLFSQIDVGDQLRRGCWAVLLFRHDCPKCQDELQHLHERAAAFMDVEDGFRICLVEVPPFGESQGFPIDVDSQLVFGRLNSDRKWFVETPAWIDLREGTVVAHLEEEDTHDDKNGRSR